MEVKGDGISSYGRLRAHPSFAAPAPSWLRERRASSRPRGYGRRSPRRGGLSGGRPAASSRGGGREPRADAPAASSGRRMPAPGFRGSRAGGRARAAGRGGAGGGGRRGSAGAGARAPRRRQASGRRGLRWWGPAPTFLPRLLRAQGLRAARFLVWQREAVLSSRDKNSPSRRNIGIARAAGRERGERHRAAAGRSPPRRAAPLPSVLVRRYCAGLSPRPSRLGAATSALRIPLGEENKQTLF